MLGYHQRNHKDFPLARFVKGWSDSDTDPSTIRDSEQEKAQRATDIVRAYNKVYKDRKSKPPTAYAESDYVLLRDTQSKPGVNAKFKSQYKGPYQIRKNLGRNRHSRVQHLATARHDSVGREVKILDYASK